MTSEPNFALFVAPLIGSPVTRVWQGYGSAIFVEFGKLHSTTTRDGRHGSPRGDWTLFIEWSWRIEGKRRIWCDSWSDGERWPRAFQRLLGQPVASIELVGRLPEVYLGLKNGLYLASMMTAEGNPAWSLSHRHDLRFSVDRRACRQTHFGQRTRGQHVVKLLTLMSSSKVGFAAMLGGLFPKTPLRDKHL